MSGVSYHKGDDKKLLNAGKKGRKERRAAGIAEIQSKEFQPPEMEVIAQHLPRLFYGHVKCQMNNEEDWNREH